MHSSCFFFQRRQHRERGFSIPIIKYIKCYLLYLTNLYIFVLLVEVVGSNLTFGFGIFAEVFRVVCFAVERDSGVGAYVFLTFESGDIVVSPVNEIAL